MRIINEVAEKHIALATPTEEEIRLRTQLREDLQVICRKVSPTAVLELFGSVACKTIRIHRLIHKTNKLQLVLPPLILIWI